MRWPIFNSDWQQKLEPRAGLQSVHTASPSTWFWLFKPLGDPAFSWWCEQQGNIDQIFSNQIRADFLPLLQIWFYDFKMSPVGRAAQTLRRARALQDTSQWNTWRFTLQSVVGHLFKITWIVAWKTVRSSAYFSLLMSSFPYDMYELYVGDCIWTILPGLSDDKDMTWKQVDGISFSPVHIHCLTDANTERQRRIERKAGPRLTRNKPRRSWDCHGQNTTWIFSRQIKITKYWKRQSRRKKENKNIPESTGGTSAHL